MHWVKGHAHNVLEVVPLPGLLTVLEDLDTPRGHRTCVIRPHDYHGRVDPEGRGRERGKERDNHTFIDFNFIVGAASVSFIA